MSDLASYSLADFVLFSPQVYFRLFELHNRALWPAQIVTFALCVAVLFCLARPTPIGMRASLVVFGIFWVSMAWSFFWQRYETINWASAYLAPIIALQGFILIAAAMRLHDPLKTQVSPARRRLLLGLYALVLFGYPMLGVLSGRAWQGAEVIGIAPDPTAIATLALVAMTASRQSWLLMPIPVFWCMVTGLTLLALDAGEFLVAPFAMIFALIASLAFTARP